MQFGKWIISLTLIFIFVCNVGIALVFGQESSQHSTEKNEYSIVKIEDAVDVNGVLDEAAWNKATVVKLDNQSKPEVNATPPVKTEFYITYDSNHLYIAFKASDPQPQIIRAHLMDRDEPERMTRNDYVGFRIDPFNNGQWAYQFTVNPLGVQSDAILDDQTGTMDFSWDAIWKSKGRITEDGFIVEAQIPFSSFNIPSDSLQTWIFDAYRSYPRNIRYMMLSRPVDLSNSSMLSQFDQLVGFQDLSSGLNLEVNPTLTSQRIDQRKQNTNSIEKGSFSVEPGLNLRWGIQPNMDISATVNPDFSHIEADALQLRENSRFVLSYPEKRPFFLEGSEVFETPLNAVFTRSILEPNAGLKFTGKEGPHIMGVFATRDQKNQMLFPSNQSSTQKVETEPVYNEVLRYAHQISPDATVGLLAEGRQAEETEYYNNLAGIDGFFRILSSNTFRFQYLHSQTNYSNETADQFNQPVGSFDGSALKMSLNHSSQNWSANADFSSISSDFRNDNGFFPRADLQSYGFKVRRIIRGSDKKWYSSIKTGPAYYLSTDQSGTWTDKAMSYAVTYNGIYQSELMAEINWGGRRVGNNIFDNLWWYQFLISLQPSDTFAKLRLYISVGDEVDFANVRKSKDLIINPGLTINLGHKLNLDIDPNYHRLSYQNKPTFSTYLLDTGLIYHLTKQLFFRVVTQYRYVNRNLDQYYDPDGLQASSKSFNYQFLFSYKLNPQSKLFLGYSSGYDAVNERSLALQNRAAFLKVGYAWVF